MLVPQNIVMDLNDVMNGQWATITTINRDIIMFHSVKNELLTPKCNQFWYDGKANCDNNYFFFFFYEMIIKHQFNVTRTLWTSSKKYQKPHHGLLILQRCIVLIVGLNNGPEIEVWFFQIGRSISMSWNQKDLMGRWWPHQHHFIFSYYGLMPCCKLLLSLLLPNRIA